MKETDSEGKENKDEVTTLPKLKAESNDLDNDLKKIESDLSEAKEKDQKDEKDEIEIKSLTEEKD